MTSRRRGKRDPEREWRQRHEAEAKRPKGRAAVKEASVKKRVAFTRREEKHKKKSPKPKAGGRTCNKKKKTQKRDNKEVESD